MRGSSRQRLSKRLELSWGSATDVATQLSGTALRNSSTEFTVTIGGRVTTWALTGFPITYEASMDMRVLCANYSCTDADNGGGEVDADGGRGVDESGGDDADGVDEQGDDNDLDFAERFELSTVTPLTISNPGAAQLGIAGEFGLLTNGLGLLSVVRMQFPVLDAEMLWSIPDTDAADAAGVPRDVAAGPFGVEGPLQVRFDRLRATIRRDIRGKSDDATEGIDGGTSTEPQLERNGDWRRFAPSDGVPMLDLNSSVLVQAAASVHGLQWRSALHTMFVL